MRTSKLLRVSCAVAALAIVLTLECRSVQAATDTYSGSGGVWNNGVSGNTIWNGSFFTNGDSAQFSLATSNSAIVLGDNITVANILSNGATTPATLTITGSAGKTLTLGAGIAGSGNIGADTAGSGSYAQNLTYASADTTGGTFFQLAPNSGTLATPTIWNMASGKTLSINPKVTGDIVDLGGNTINLTGLGTVQFSAGANYSVQNGTFNVNAGVLNFAGGSSSPVTVQNSVTVNVATGGILRLTPNTSGANFHYNELVNLNGGTLAQGSGTVVQSGAVTVSASGGAFTTAGNGTMTIAGGISGSGPLTFSVAGANSIILSASNSFTGNMTVTANTLSVAGTGSLGGGSYAGAIALNTNALLSFSTSTNQTLSGVISGNGGLKMAGTGSVLTLTGSNTYFGATTVASGALVATNTAALPNYPFPNVSVAGGAVLGVQANTNGTSGWNSAEIDALRASVNFTASNSGLGIDTTQGSFSYVSTITNPQPMALYVMGTNTLTLTTTNSYTGGTTVSAGTLQIGDGVNIGNVGPGNLTLAAGTTLDLNLPGVQTVGTTAGYTQFTFNNNSTIKNETGNTTLLSVNTTTSGGSNYMQFNGTVNIAANNGSTLTLQTIGNPGSSSGDLPGMNITGGAVINTTGNVILDASAPTDSNFMRSFDLSGTTATFNANSGTLTINTAGQAGAAVGFYVKNAGTTITTNGNVIFNNNGPSRGNGWSSSISTINVNSGTLTANGNTGNGMNISNSTLNIATGATLAFGGSDSQTMNGTTWTLGATAGNLAVANAVSLSGAFTLAGGVPGSVSSFSNVISGSGAINKSDLGLVVLSGNNSYAGVTTVSNGTLQLGGPSALPANSAVTANGGVFDLNANNAAVGQLNGAAGVITDNSPGAGTTTLSATGGNFNGTIRSGLNKALALDVPGPGALTLGGTNTYTGATTVNNGGALFVNGKHSGGDAYTIASGGTLGGVGTVSGTNTVNVSGAIAPGALATNAINVGTLTLPSLSTAGGGTFNFVLSNSATSGNDLIQVNGNLTLNGQSTVSIYKTSVLSNGNYPLFKYTGTLTYSGSATALAYAPANLLSARQHATFDYGTSGVVSLDIVGNAANLTWVGGTTGAGTNIWDQDDTANTVWNNGTGSDYYATSDKVTFSAAASAANTTVNLNGSLAPGSVTVTGSKDYTFTGSGTIDGSTRLVMAGPGSLTIASGSNSYTGGTSISGGTLNANAAYTLGNGTLALGGGVLNANDAQSPSSVTINGGTFNANAVNALGSGPLTLGSGVLNVNFAQSSSSVTVSAGLLNIGDPNSLGSGTLTISGGSLDNTSATPMTLATNNVQNWNGSFTFVGSSPLSTGTGAVTLGVSPTVNVGSGGTLSVDSAIGDAGNNFALTAAGPGAVILTQSNTYGGGTMLVGGMLVVNNNSALGSGSLAINGGTLDSTTAAITLANNPRQAWNSDFTFIGTQNLNLGTGIVTLASSRTVTVNANTLTVGGPIGDGGNGYSLRLAGSGVLSLNGANTYSGATTINGGTLQIGGAGVLGSGSYNAAINDNGTLYVDSTANQTFGGTISGAGSLMKAAAGVLTLTASNNYTGGTTVNCPSDSTALVIANNNALGSGTLTIIGGNMFAGGVNVNPGVTVPNAIVLQPNGNRATMSLGASSTLAGPIVIDGSVNANLVAFISSAGSVGAPTLAGTITHSGPNANLLAFRGSGVYGIISGNIQYDTGTVELLDSTNWELTGGSNNYGTFTISNAGARLYVGAANTLAPGGVVNDAGAGGTLVLNNFAATSAYNQTIAGLDQAVKVTATTGSPVLTMSNDTTNYNTTGSITGPVALVKAGAYTQMLSGSGNYTGGTTILGGVLQLGNSAALGNGGLTANSGTLDLGGFSPTVASLGGAAGTITNTGFSNSNLTISQSAATTFGGTIIDGPSAPFITVGLALNGGTLTLSGTNTYTGGTTVNNGTLIATNSQAIADGTNLYVGDPASLALLPAAIVPAAAIPTAAPTAVSAVPEPGTVALVVAAIVGLAVCRRMRRR